MSNSLQPHGLQHTRLPCPAPNPRAYSNSRPLSRWCHPTISSSVTPFSSHLQSFPASVSFPELVLCIRWPKDCSFSFSISPSNEYSGLISFRMDWLGCKSTKSRVAWSNRQIWPCGTKWNRAKANRVSFDQENTKLIENTVFQQYKRQLYTWT